MPSPTTATPESWTDADAVTTRSSTLRNQQRAARQLGKRAEVSDPTWTTMETTAIRRIPEGYPKDTTPLFHSCN